MSLKAISTIAGLIGIFIGLLIQVSSNPTDQIGGKIVIAFFVAMLGISYFASGRAVTAAQWALCAPAILFAAYITLRRLWS